jgi:hypothetical protein
MRYQIMVTESMSGAQRHVLREDGPDQFTSFPAEVGNPVYDSFLESQGLTDAEVQTMEPDIWHDMA